MVLPVTGDLQKRCFKSQLARVKKRELRSKERVTVRGEASRGLIRQIGGKPPSSPGF